VEQQKTNPRTNEQLMTMKTEIFNKIIDKWVPNTIALDYFKAIYPSFADFWLFRRQFAYQYATTAFMTYIMHMSGRYPMKLSISKRTGDIWASDALPNLSSGKAVLYNPEAVPFRLTPNLQTLMGPLAVEGIFTASLMAIARGLAEGDQGYEMAQLLAVFVRDEMYAWAAGRGVAALNEMQGEKLREGVGINVESVIRRALSLCRTQNVGANAGPSAGAGAGAAAGGEGAQNGAGANGTASSSASVGVLPACQNVVDLVSRATNPEKLASMDAMWLAWL
jgi:transformation/transcription domain-associated protein